MYPEDFLLYIKVAPEFYSIAADIQMLSCSNSNIISKKESNIKLLEVNVLSSTSESPFNVKTVLKMHEENGEHISYGKGIDAYDSIKDAFKKLSFILDEKSTWLNVA